MKRMLLKTLVVTGVTFLFSQSVQAMSYYGYVRNWETEPSGDTVFSVLSNSDVNTTAVGQYVMGYCGSGAYRLKVVSGNYDETFLSLLRAVEKNYRVLMNVTSCENNINIIDSAKICSWTGDC